MRTGLEPVPTPLIYNVPECLFIPFFEKPPSKFSEALKMPRKFERPSHFSKNSKIKHSCALYIDKAAQRRSLYI